MTVKHRKHDDQDTLGQKLGPKTQHIIYRSILSNTKCRSLIKNKDILRNMDNKYKDLCNGI